jgi:N-acetylglucosaminyldiphosphoundecaprenol N-acetyl-beta-D-mannosaminyltransferase
MFRLRVEGASISVNAANRAALLREVRNRIRNRSGFAIATLNLDHLVKLRKVSGFRQAYAKQDLVTADGHPIVWLSRLSNKPVSLVTGSDLVDPLASLAAEERVPIALLGATSETLGSAAVELTARHPGLVVAARLAPGRAFDPYGAEADGLIAALRESGAGIALLALGAPRQEIFAARCRELLPDIGFVSVGAGLDFIAGHQRRAPIWLQRLALEWLWRIACEPRRLGMRYLQCALAFPRVMVDTLVSARFGRASISDSPAPLAAPHHLTEVL